MKKTLLIFFVLLIASGCGRATLFMLGFGPEELRTSVEEIAKTAVEFQGKEIRENGLIDTSGVKSDGYLADYKKSKQEKFCIVTNKLRAVIKAEGWSMDVVDAAFWWWHRNQNYCLTKTTATQIVSLHGLYNNGFTGECKTLHFGFAAYLKYYLDCPYPMQVIVYERPLEPMFHMALKVNGEVYDLQNYAAIAMSMGLSLVQYEFTAYNIY